MNDSAVATDVIALALQRADATARPAMAANFTHPLWVMSPAEFRAFWGGTRLASVGTAGATGAPHAAPVEVTLRGDTFVVPSFASTVRLEDLRANPRIVLTAWDDAYHAAIVYGQATFADASTGMVSVEVRPTRIYAIRAPNGHPHARGPSPDGPASNSSTQSQTRERLEEV
ncbi:hypothetical protein AYO38_00620 [bacterium SCGC AG-212-C10]|nr:hypothetical protein AYO38_00620 [bacterium SCGC AG-212-C10]